MDLQGIASETIETRHLFDMAVRLAPAQTFATPDGPRQTYVIRDGSLRGERLSGRLLPGGGDWIRFGSDGVGRLDVRATIEPDDGPLVHLTSLGVAALDDEAKRRFLGGGRVDAVEMHARSQLRFETDPAGPLDWLNRVTTVAINALGPGVVEYRVFEVL